MARYDEDETAGEPWFSVGPRDVFPEELWKFLFSGDAMREAFLSMHPEVATPKWWLATQQACRAGEERAMFPYSAARRFVR